MITVAIKLTVGDISKGYTHENGISKVRKYKTLKQALAFARRLYAAGYLVWIE